MGSDGASVGSVRDSRADADRAARLRLPPGSATTRGSSVTSAGTRHDLTPHRGKPAITTALIVRDMLLLDPLASPRASTVVGRFPQ